MGTCRQSRTGRLRRQGCGSRTPAYNVAVATILQSPPQRAMWWNMSVSRPVSFGPTLQQRAAMASGDLTGCPWHDVKAKLREVGLRPTRQRLALGWPLLANGARHFTAEML